MTIDEIWEDNAYRGLWGEVVEGDIYKIRQLKFVPDVIFDLGANVGTFSKFAHELFPNALIISVEPDKQNIEHFKQFNMNDSIVLYDVAIGDGELFRDIKSRNGSHECYLSKTLGYEAITESEILKKVEVNSISLDSLYDEWVIGDQKYIVKIDIEGSETHIFKNQKSMHVLRNADYIAMELHYFAMTPNGVLEVMEMTNKALESLKETHDTVYEHPMFYATKK